MSERIGYKTIFFPGVYNTFRLLQMLRCSLRSCLFYGNEFRCCQDGTLPRWFLIFSNVQKYFVRNGQNAISSLFYFFGISNTIVVESLKNVHRPYNIIFERYIFFQYTPKSYNKRRTSPLIFGHVVQLVFSRYFQHWFLFRF